MPRNAVAMMWPFAANGASLSAARPKPALPPSRSLPRSMMANNPLFHQLALTLDSLANAWNQTVLGYNLETQRALLTRAGFDDADWRTMGIMMIAAAGFITLLIALLTLRGRAHRCDLALEAYQRFCAKAARAGIARHVAEGPLDFLSRVAQAKPESAAAADAITRLYIALRYEKHSKNKGLDDLIVRVRQFTL